MWLQSCGGGGETRPPEPASIRCAAPYPTDDLPAPPDPLVAQQWHLSNTGQSAGVPGQDIRAFAAWERLRQEGCSPGGGVRVAVIDQAIDLAHEDLRDNVATGLSFDYRDWTATEPLPRSNDGLTIEQRGHGTAVAGIIAARGGNGIGGSGVAPRAQLAGYSALARADAIADALQRNLEALGNRKAIDVFHNSWGSPDTGRLEKASNGFSQAIERGLTSGRGGLGALYVFSAGNGGCLGYPRTDCRDNVDLSNYDGYLNHRGVIVACAFDHQGKRPRWAERGSNLLVCGPSGPALVLDTPDRSAITTTALNNGYRDDFANSSASAPMVSGVIALMLSANVDLSARDVRLILAQSARRNDPDDPDWEEAGTGGGFAFNPNYGFGAVDADKAVELARGWQTVGTESGLLSCTTQSQDSASIAIPDGMTDVLKQVMRIDASCRIRRIEYIELRLTIDHQYSGDLDIDLVSPSGTRSLLARARDCGAQGFGRTGDCGSYNDTWPITTVRHLDEPAIGDWSLQIADRVAGKIGSLTTWTLRIWGR